MIGIGGSPNLFHPKYYSSGRKVTQAEEERERERKKEREKKAINSGHLVL